MNPYGPPAAPQYQQHPQAWPAQANEDEQHLNVLAICHFVYAGLLGLAGMVGIVYVIVGVVMAAAVASSGASGGAGAGAAFAGIFAFIGGLVTLLLWGKATCLIISAMGMRRRRRRTFSFVIACISCAAVPLGTVLGIFTILVLSRPSVKAMYAYAEQT